MGKRTRAKRARQARPEPAQAQQTEPARSRRTLWIAVGAAVAVVVIAGGVFALTRSDSKAAPFSSLAADEDAPAALSTAADAVGFHETEEAGSGQIESMPASAARPARSPLLLPVGTEAPDFELQTPQGEPVRLKDLRGRTVLLEFFATWCGLCNTEARHLKTIAESLPADRFAVVSINADAEDAASVLAYHRFYSLPFPSLLDPSLRPRSFNKPGLPGPVTQQYGMKSLPTFYVIDRDGKVSWRSDGEQPNAKLREELERADES